MADVDIGPPRPGKGIKLSQFKQGGQQVALITLTPGAKGAIAVVRWANPTNPRFTRLQPASMQVVLLQELPKDSPAGSGLRHVDVRATRELLLAVIDDLPPQTACYIYLLDNVAASAYHGDPGVELLAKRNYAALREAAAELPGAVVGHVVSTALAKTLQVNAKSMKARIALETAVAVFPQMAGRLRTMTQHGPLVVPLLLAAHVLGAKRLPAVGAAAPADAPPAVAVAPPAVAAAPVPAALAPPAAVPAAVLAPGPEAPAHSAVSAVAGPVEVRTPAKRPMRGRGAAEGRANKRAAMELAGG